ncbi:hypothetical protein [Caulobacter sp. NIBR1757]|uniref:hypothetical protein n=1 Tax=Caulobacter sp. NIBR1757 TaxID=3016000 RepID=UPI0022F11AF4|nr:hypothetical protein [Caulobacter sp. NIBR1757]
MMRLSLWPLGNMAAPEAIVSGKPLSRETWLRDVFGRSIEFDYKGRKYHFVPTLDEIPAPFVAGRIGLLSRVLENEPPDHGLEDTVRDRWKAVAVLLDPRAHEDGQKVAVEFGTGVAKPFPIFSSLIRHINGQLGPYAIEVKPITAASSFWDFVQKNEGQVVSVTFEFLAPNMFGIVDDMDKEANDLKKYENAKSASLKIESNEGLNLHTKRVEQTVNYTTRGGGNIKARARHDDFNSDRTATRVRVPEDPIGEAETPVSLRSRIARALRYVFLND